MKKITTVLWTAAFVFQLTACARPVIPTYAGIGNKRAVLHHKKLASEPCPCNKSKNKSKKKK